MQNSRQIIVVIKQLRIIFHQSWTFVFFGGLDVINSQNQGSNDGRNGKRRLA